MTIFPSSLPTILVLGFRDKLGLSSFLNLIEHYNGKIWPLIEKKFIVHLAENIPIIFV